MSESIERPEVDDPRAIRALSERHQVPELKVIELYKAEYRRLAAESRIANFLSVLAMRNTRAILRAGGTVN